MSIQQTEARSVAKHPTVNRTALHIQAKMPTMLRMRNPDLEKGVYTNNMNVCRPVSNSKD